MKVSKKYKIVIGIVSIIVVLFLIFFETMEQKYKKNYALWQSHDIQNYTYTIQLKTKFSGIDVDQAKILVYHKQADKNFLNYHGIGHIKYNDMASIDNIFTRIEKLILKKDEYFMGMCIEYDSKYGYPKTFTVGYKSNVLRVTYVIKDFKILSDKKLKKEEPVCATYTVAHRGAFKSNSPEKKERNYRNKYAMEMAGAVYKYNGECKTTTEK